jgi:hypothetical protein
MVYFNVVIVIKLGQVVQVGWMWVNNVNVVINFFSHMNFDLEIE